MLNEIFTALELEESTLDTRAGKMIYQPAFDNL